MKSLLLFLLWFALSPSDAATPYALIVAGAAPSDAWPEALAAEYGADMARAASVADLANVAGSPTTIIIATSDPVEARAMLDALCARWPTAYRAVRLPADPSAAATIADIAAAYGVRAVPYNTNDAQTVDLIVRAIATPYDRIYLPQVTR